MGFIRLVCFFFPLQDVHLFFFLSLFFCVVLLFLIASDWEVGLRDEDEGWMVRSGDSASLPGRLLQRGNSLYQGPEFLSGGSVHIAPSLAFSVFSRVVKPPISGPVSSLFSLNTAHIIVNHPFLNSP